MDFTFGICCTKANINFHKRIIASIEKQNIPNYEIIFVGEECFFEINKKTLNFIYFDESIKPNWITKKKNLIAKFAKYENIVFMHDYIVFDDQWYEGYLKHGNDFEVCMNKIYNLDGKRNIDWLIYYQDLQLPKGEQLLPYSENFSEIMYIPGFFWVAKKNLMKEFPLNENLSWGEAEDVEWSKRVRQKYNFSINAHSSVKFLKQKEYTLNEMSQYSLDIVKDFYNRLNF